MQTADWEWPHLPSVQALLSKTPFLSSSLPPDQLQLQTATFLEMFRLAVDTWDESEEEWAYRKMKEAYIALMGDPPVDPVHELPAGLWEAMSWAAEIKVAHEKGFLTDQAIPASATPQLLRPGLDDPRTVR